MCLKDETKLNITWYRVLDSVICVPSFCHLLGSIVPVGLLLPNSHPGPPFLLFFLFVQQAIVESHSEEQENAGDNEEDSTALVCVLVIVIDVLEPPC